MAEAQAADAARIVKDVASLLERSKLEEAVALACHALDLGVEDSLLLNLRAFWLEGQKRAGEALVDLQRAHALAPQDPMVLNALGLCLAKLGRLGEAHEAFVKCRALAPDFAPARFNAGWTLEEMGELDAAQTAFEDAARLTPSSADPPARLAALAARRGQWETVHQQAQKALGLAPGHPAATIAMANAEIAEGAFAPARSRLQVLANASGATEQDRATAISLLGDILDAEGRYSDAFAAYTACNALFKIAFADRLAAHSEMPMSDYVAWLLESFESPSMPEWPKLTPGSIWNSPDRHVFVLGFPRSGTTLLEEVLACHPETATTGEKDALGAIVRELFSAPEQLDRLITLDEEETARYRLHYWESLHALGVDTGKKLLIDKQPFNTIRLPLIAKLFPDAKIVFCLRDPRDVVLSCFRRRFVANASNAEFLTLDGAARLYDVTMRLATLYRSKIPLRLHQIRHEDLVTDFDSQILALCSFLGLEWTGAFRAFSERSRDRQVTTPSATQIQKGLAREGIGHWRHYNAELAPALPILDRWAGRLNYPPS